MEANFKDNVFVRVPVLDKNKKVMGVVTPSSILDLLQN